MSAGSEAARGLAACLAGLCQDADLRLEIGEGSWHYAPEKHAVLAPSGDLESKGPVFLAALASHEASHARISRYLMLEQPDFPLMKLLANGFEDRRVNAWIKQRFPGVAPWQREAYAACRVEIHPARTALFQQFLFAADPGDEGIVREVAPAVTEALERTAGAREAHRRCAPPPDLAVAPGDEAEIERRCREEVGPLLLEPLDPLTGPVERMILVHAAEAHRILVENILPAARELYEKDVARVAEFLDRHPETRRRSYRKALDKPMADDIVDSAMSSPLEGAPAPKRGALNLARRVLELHLGLAEQPRAPAPAAAGRRRGTLTDALERALSRMMIRGDLFEDDDAADDDAPPYERILEKVGPGARELSRRFEELLRNSRRPRQRPGFASGTGIHVGSFVQWAARPDREARFWTRRIKPSARDAAILLLVDLSGSMAPRVRETQEAVVMLFEALLLVGEGLRLSVMGFQDELIPFSAFGDPAEKVREALASMPREVAGDRPGGHNNPSYNDDGPTLLEASERLLREPAAQRLLVVISDGEPAGRRSTAEDLHAAVAKVSAEPAIDLFALGIGPDTRGLADYYGPSRCAVEIPPEDLPRQLGGLIERRLARNV